MTDGRQAKDWIFIDDVAGGIIALLGAELPPGTTVELGTGVATESVSYTHLDVYKRQQ